MGNGGGGVNEMAAVSDQAKVSLPALAHGLILLKPSRWTSCNLRCKCFFIYILNQFSHSDARLEQ